MKKKFTMLFAALFAFAGVAKAQHWLQPTVSTGAETYEYYIMNYRNADYFVTTTSGLAGGAQQLGSANAFDDTKAKVTFKLVEGGKLWSTNTTTPLILGYTTTDEAANSVQLFAGDSQEGYTWKIESANGGNTLSAGDSNNSWNMHGGAGANIGLYRKSDGGSNWVFVPANDAAAAKAAEAKAEYSISTEYYYQIKNVMRSTMLGANANGMATTVTTNSTSDLNQLWAFEEGENGTFYLRNAGQEKYLGNNTENNQAWPVVDAENKIAFEVEMVNFSKKNYGIKYVGGDAYSFVHEAGWGSEERVVRWEISAEASQWYLEKTNILATAKEISFTYSFVYDGKVKATQECTGFVGEDYADITVLPYGTTAAKPEGKLTEDVDGTVVEVEVTNNLPFVAAADYASIKNWYYIQMHSSGGSYSRYIQAMDGYIEWLDVDMNMSEADAYTWGFIGNPFDGFKLVNYAAGETKAVNSNGSGNPALGDYATGVQWIIAASSTNPTAEYFCFKYPTSNQYMNAQSGKVAFWGSKDQGSTMWVTERDLSGATELLALVQSANAMVAALRESTGVGSVTSESLAALQEEIEDAQAAADAKEGCIEAQVALQAAIANLETIQPEATKFYILHNNYTDKYANVSDEAGMRTAATVGISEVFQFIPAEGGNFYLKNVERGTYLSINPTHNNQHGYNPVLAGATTVENAHAVTIANLGAQNIVSITPVGGATLHHDTNQNNVFSYNGGLGSKSEWVIEEVNITALSHVVSISDVKWATLVLGYDATIPAGVTAYAVTEAGNGVAQLAEVTGVIPAYEAVLLNAVEAGSYDFFKYAESAEAVVGNMLRGSTVNVNVEGLGYVLAAKEGNVGLYKAALNVSTNTENDGTKEEPAVTYEAFLNNAFKAYLPAPAGAEAAMFTLGRGGEDEDATAIDQLINANGELVIYDLSGRRVQKMEKGIYIVNGKKVVIK